MGATFSIKVRTEGSSHQKVYKGKDGKAVANLMIGAIENKVFDLTGRMVAHKGLEASERTLWYAAIYFQRLISRTPRDEDYSYRDDKGHIHYHKADDDYMQDYWTARYWNYKGITAKYLRESCGCTFEVFNNQKEIETIYGEFRDRFFGAAGSRGRANKESGRTTLKSVRFYCDYPKDEEHELRYHLLEYGGYIGDGIIKKDGENKHYHGVANGHSIQAARGMTAMTDMEFKSGQFKAPGKRVYTKNILKHIGGMQNITEEVKKILKGKTKLSDSDVAKIMSLYGV